MLHLTQPAVSLQLKGLEESTGLQLFNRTPGGFTLTEAGAALLPLAHKAVSATADFRTPRTHWESLRERCVSAPSWIPNDPARTVRAKPRHLPCRRPRSSCATA
jgi:DNA-binding transcriptional LysR family regulator